MATVKLDPAKGIQIPNLTTTERNAISSPETGAIIWNTTTSEINQYNGSAWEITYTDTNTQIAGITSAADATAITIDSAEKINIHQGRLQLGHINKFIDTANYGQDAVNIAYHPYSNGVVIGQSYPADSPTTVKKIIASSNTETRFFTVASGTETERVRIDQHGIKFNGDTASANGLDDYEEGTWTPTFGGATISASTTGYYTKIGRQVFFQWYSSSATISSASGGAEIGGLPFTSSSATDAYGLFTYHHGTGLDGGSTGGFITRNNNNMHFIDTNNTSKASYVNGSGKYIMISGTYFTA